MDLDIDMGDAPDAGQELPPAELPNADDILQPDEPEEPGEVVDDEPSRDDDGGEEARIRVPTKVHIRGVDALHTDDIKAYVRGHYGPVDRVEWIDDTSANLVFASEPSARDALVALSAIDIADPSALGVGEALTAKPLADRPDVALLVRFAVAADRKQAGAALRSRYYLLHPEHDPEERRRRSHENRSRYRDRDGGGYRRGGRGRDSDDPEPFDASMYDDAPAPARRRRLSDPDDDRPRSYARENRGKELFAGRAAGRDRDRSASPQRDGDGDDLMGDGRLASSSRNNRTSARSLKDRISTGNKAKELFPTKASSGKGGRLDQLEEAIGSARLREEDRPKVVAAAAAAADGSAFSIRGIAKQRDGESGGFSIKGAASARELFPDKFGAGGGGGGGGGNVGKELFEGGRSKPRQRAEDLFS